MKLYDIPKQSKLKLTIVNGDTEREDMVTFHHIDGMYSYCTTSDGAVVHLSASTPMKKVDDYYIIDEA